MLGIGNWDTFIFPADWTEQGLPMKTFKRKFRQFGNHDDPGVFHVLHSASKPTVWVFNLPGLAMQRADIICNDFLLFIGRDLQTRFHGQGRTRTRIKIIQ